MIFEFLLRFSVFYFLFSATPTGFLTFCLPADEATAKSVTKYSPTDSEKQTAIDCKDNGLFFFDKAFALSKTIHVSQDPARAAVACYARNGACLVCVCVCVCVCVSTYPQKIRYSAYSSDSRFFIRDITIHT